MGEGFAFLYILWARGLGSSILWARVLGPLSVWVGSLWDPFRYTIITKATTTTSPRVRRDAGDPWRVLTVGSVALDLAR